MSGLTVESFVEISSQQSQGSQPGLMIPPIALLLNVQRNVKADLRITGKEVKREDLERLKRQLEQQIDMLLEAFQEET